MQFHLLSRSRRYGLSSFHCVMYVQSQVVYKHVDEFEHADSTATEK